MDTDECINDTDDVNDIFLIYCDVEVVETEAKVERNSHIRMRDTRANFTGTAYTQLITLITFKCNW